MNNKKIIDFLIQQKNKVLDEAGIRDVVLNYEHLIDLCLKADNNTRPSTVIIEPNDAYSRKWTLGKKIMFILNNTGRFLHIREICSDILNRDASKKKPDSYINIVRGTLNRLKKVDENIVVYSKGQTRNSYWGLKTWLDEAGNPMPEHKQIDLINKSEIDLFENN